MQDAAHLTVEFMRRLFGVASGDFGFEIIGKIVILQQDTVFERPMSQIS